MDDELLLFDRLEVIKAANERYDLERNAYLSFSGGKDSTILHHLLDIAIPNNKIPRVFIDTGIEYDAIRRFVLTLAENDDRITIIKPSTPIKPMLERDGYPFKSKEHSMKVGLYQKGSRAKNIMAYKDGENSFSCPKMLLYQFKEGFDLKLSSDCCLNLKKRPVHKWEAESGRHIAITGMRREEGGQRAHLKGCILTDRKGNVRKFHPLLVVTEEWEDWFVKQNNISLCELYYPPFNFKRTGCKGCPFSLDLQEQLTTMEVYIPNERKQCEIIWKPVYEEYRRIHYRLTDNEQLKLF